MHSGKKLNKIIIFLFYLSNLALIFFCALHMRHISTLLLRAIPCYVQAVPLGGPIKLQVQSKYLRCDLTEKMLHFFSIGFHTFSALNSPAK